MTRKLDQLKRLLPGAATVLTLSIAVTLRVERSCSEVPHGVPTQIPAALYSYPEILVSLFAPDFTSQTRRRLARTNSAIPASNTIAP
jgi:hypothetical protein